MSNTPTQSRAFRINHVGSLDGLISDHAHVPAPGAGEVLVRVRASSLNYRDVLIVEGNYVLPVPAGRIPLSDGAGEVVAVGAGVDRFSVGERVVNAFFPEWVDGPYAGNYSHYSVDLDGWLTDYRVVHAQALSRIPDSLQFDEAATLPCAGVTAWSALKGVQAGDTVLTQGTGGVSLFAIQIAKALGARVIATTSSDAKRDQLHAIGADETINYTTVPQWAQRVRELTGGAGANRIVEVGGPGTFEQSVKAVAISGQVSMIGVLAGLQGSVDFMSMFMSQARYQPLALGSRQDLDDLMQFLVAHGISPIIDSRHAFEDAKQGFARLITRDVFGKVVITH